VGKSFSEKKADGPVVTEVHGLDQGCGEKPEGWHRGGNSPGEGAVDKKRKIQ